MRWGSLWRGTSTWAHERGVPLLARGDAREFRPMARWDGYRYPLVELVLLRLAGNPNGSETRRLGGGRPPVLISSACVQAVHHLLPAWRR